MKINNSVFALHVNGSGETPIEPLFKGIDDLTAHLLNGTREEIEGQILTVETRVIQNLAAAFPVGGKKLWLNVVPENATGEILEVSESSSAFTASFDHLVYGLYDNPLTDVGIHVSANFSTAELENDDVGVVHSSCGEGFKLLGAEPRFASNYPWQQIQYRNGFYYLTTLDYAKGGDKGDAIRHAENASKKHDYIDFLLRGVSFNINVSVNRQYAAGFIYQMMLDREHGMAVRNYHIGKAIEQRRAYKIMHPRDVANKGSDWSNGGNGGGEPKEIPSFSLRANKNPKKEITLDSTNVNMTVVVFRSGTRLLTIKWDGTKETMKRLTDLQSYSQSYGFTII